MLAKEIEEATGVPLSVAKRIVENTSKGVDNTTLLRLSLGLRCSISDLFEIDAVDDESAINDENARNAEDD